ncbi:MAG: DNA polymerase III subunit chi [Gammaproteobacteria bacterium]|nr:DNA polymerase III subunit chi [Gammaproteobacteria bacterium]
MISVDFYILPDEQLENLQKYACKLAESNWQSGKRVLIQTDSANDSQSLDNLLWNIREDSFIPHGIATLEPSDQQQPILISHQKINDVNFQSIINLSSRPADLTHDHSLMIEEILNQDESRKQSGRQNYKTYRESGYTLKHHTLEGSDG